MSVCTRSPLKNRTISNMVVDGNRSGVYALQQASKLSRDASSQHHIRKAENGEQLPERSETEMQFHQSILCYGGTSRAAFRFGKIFRGHTLIGNMVRCGWWECVSHCHSKQLTSPLKRRATNLHTHTHTQTRKNATGNGKAYFGAGEWARAIA